MKRVLNIVKAPASKAAPVYRCSKPVEVPSSFSLEHAAPPTRDQGQEGSCGGQSATEVMYGYRNLHITKPIVPLDTLFSANDIYWRARARMGETQEDSGVDNVALATAMVRDGMCEERFRPYNDEDFQAEPTPVQSVNAGLHKLGAYHLVTSTRDMCEVLFSKYPMVLGVTLYSSFMDEQAERTGIIPMPKPGESIEGGHDMSVWAYDKSMKIGSAIGAIKLLNHWSDTWGCPGGPYGQRGYCWMPMDLIDRHSLDTIVAHFGKPW